jgi:hypothetical protein
VGWWGSRLPGTVLSPSTASSSLSENSDSYVFWMSRRLPSALGAQGIEALTLDLV